MTMKLIVAVAAVAVALLAGQQVNGSRVSISRSSHLRDGETYAPGDLIFEDNFDTLNLSIWTHEANMNGGSVTKYMKYIIIINCSGTDSLYTVFQNGEFQIYDRFEENAYTKDGVLHIKPTFTVDRFGGNVEKLFNGYHYMEWYGNAILRGL